MADASEEVEKYAAANEGWARTAKDLFAGAAGGVAQVLLGEFRRTLSFGTWTRTIAASRTRHSPTRVELSS